MSCPGVTDLSWSDLTWTGRIWSELTWSNLRWNQTDLIWTELNGTKMNSNRNYTGKKGKREGERRKELLLSQTSVFSSDSLKLCQESNYYYTTFYIIIIIRTKSKHSMSNTVSYLTIVLFFFLVLFGISLQGISVQFQHGKTSATESWHQAN